MKARVILFVLVSALAWSIAHAETNVYMARLFADVYRTEDFLQVDDASKIDELQKIKIVSRDGKLVEVHGIRHIYDGRSIYLTEVLRHNFLSGARIYMIK